MHTVKKRRLSDRSVDLRKGSSSMSEKQRSLMLDFLSEHPCMVLDRSVGGTANKPSIDELWENLALILNNCGSGAQKDGCGWRRSWHDLKRYESLKAKESMTKLGKMNEKMNEQPTLVLSPLQERIANLLNVSISDVAECVDPNTSHKISHQLTQPCDEGQDSTKPQVSKRDAKCEGGSITGTQQGGGNSAADLNLAQALQNVASALTQRNEIEERKLRVFENLLTVYAAKNGIAITDAVNLDRDLT